MRYLRLVPLLWWCVALPAPAQEDTTPELATRFERYHAEYRLNDDGSHTESISWAMTALKERAIEQVKHASITYSTSIQKAEVLSAYTRKADGRRIDSPKSNFQVKVNKGKGKDAPVFSDMTTLSVVFPEVTVGDTVVFAYRIVQTEPMFPGKFSTMATFPRQYAYDEVKIRFDAPAGLWSQYAARGMQEQVVEKGGRKIIEWVLRNPQPVSSKRRNYSVYDVEQEPGFAYSTFRGYGEIAEAYAARALPKAAVTERVSKLAEEIAPGKGEARVQARALYDWVATRISYAGNCIGVGAVVPHDIPFILDNRMGDCKDHATLLQALLAAKGIKSTQALVNSGSTYQLARIPVVSAVNHVINYLPDLDLYADSTAASIPFGMLPFSVADKPVLHVEGFRLAQRTPAQPVGSNRQHMRMHARIAADGSLSGDIEVNLNGIFAANARAWLRDSTREYEEEIVKNVLQSQGYIGSGRFEKQDPTALRDVYQYKATFDVKRFVQRPGAGAFSIAPLFWTEAPVSRYVMSALEEVEAVDVACSSGISTEEYVYQLPENMTLLSVPANLAISNDFLSYRASYKLKGSTLSVKRVFEDKTRGHVCSPEVSKAYQQFANKAVADVKAQVVYK